MVAVHFATSNLQFGHINSQIMSEKVLTRKLISYIIFSVEYGTDRQNRISR